MGGAVTNSNAFTLRLIFGMVFIFLAVSACIISCVSYCGRMRPSIVAAGFIRYAIRIEGEEWVRFVNYFFSSTGRPSRARGWWFCWGRYGLHYKHSMQRGYGYIILGSLGLMIDDLFCTTYNRHIVINVEMLNVESSRNDNNNELIVDKMIRVWLCRRVYDSRWPPTPFKVDFFLPSQIPAYEIPGIMNFIAKG
ncbi:unnamed protein product [Rotaria sp. Silwood1]|nr:unnamed protein product [Rotaria sp. Silwood1]